MKFDEAYKLVGLAEGKWTDDLRDSGGLTACGLARNKNPDLPIWDMIDRWMSAGNNLEQTEKIARSDPKFMAFVRSTYCGRYWHSCHCDDLPSIWRYPVFSCSVNCGSKVAIKLLQKSLGVEADGIYGAKTTWAVGNSARGVVLKRFYDNWHNYYDEIVKKDENKRVFLKGWHNRIEKIHEDNHE